MGRVKLDIKKLENSSSRQATYSKRKHGILKKAEELATLCDIDLALVMFSPGGKPSIRCGKNGIEHAIAKYNQLPPHERTKKKLEGLEALKKTYKKKSDHDVNVQDFIGPSIPTIKDLTDQAAGIQTRIAEIHERLRCWANPDKASNLELVMQMEDSLQKSLDQIQKAKGIFQKRQCVALESYNEYNELPFHVSEQQLQQLLWATSDDIPDAVLTSEPMLSTKREMESSTGSTSGSNFNCLSTGSKSEEYSPGQLSTTDNAGQDAFQGLQFGGQYPYPQHAVSMQGVNNLQAMVNMNQQFNTPVFNSGGNYQPTGWPGVTNHLPFQSPASAAFGYYLSYQNPTVPAPALPTTYESMTRDTSHLLFDYALNHHP
ncbi:agamous-like MADS-box protein AGL30 [Silene latifolia]|uniref:agamous-like MADS-box protein AGL30 n=1 Tax=Silene latifolia TaxID=37657 RepID=UPI003D76D3DD